MHVTIGCQCGMDWGFATQENFDLNNPASREAYKAQPRKCPQCGTPPPPLEISDLPIKHYSFIYKPSVKAAEERMKG